MRRLLGPPAALPGSPLETSVQLWAKSVERKTRPPLAAYTALPLLVMASRATRFWSGVGVAGAKLAPPSVLRSTGCPETRIRSGLEGSKTKLPRTGPLPDTAVQWAPLSVLRYTRPEAANRT